MKYDIKTLEFNKIILDLANFAKTNYAKELINNLNPANSYDEILKLNLETKEAYQAIIKYGELPLGGLYDIKKAIQRAKAGGVLGSDELLNIVGLLDCGNNVIKYFNQLKTFKLETPYLDEYIKVINNPQALKTNITLAIGPDSKVLDNASRELFMIRKSLKSLENRLRSKLNELLTTRASMLTEQLIVIRDGRMCLPVKIEHKNTFKGIVHD
ncbi:MAG: hypothetical protein IJY14_03240, partial [Acholeplasmatales bacterium]|nr:hypothetical protein [Acholeplasmatales bacterium]